MHRRTHRRTTRAVTAAAGALVAIGVWAVPASAHVEADPSEAPAGSTTVISFTIPHGCAGSPTTGVDMKLPEGVTGAKPVYQGGWTAAVATGAITPFTNEDGEKITEAPTEINWTGGPLPDDQVLELRVQVTLPDKAGETVTFPTVQTCEVGTTDWIELTGADGKEPEHPAPAVTLTAAIAGGEDDHDHATTTVAGAPAGDDHATTESASAAVSKAQDDADSAKTFGIAGVGVGAVGLLVGLGALLRGRGAAPKM